MAWHRIGNSFYNDQELKGRGNELLAFLVDICLPGLLTYLGVTALAPLLSHIHFFGLHTTTAKLVDITAGLFIFSIGYACRMFIIALAFLALIGAFIFGISVDFFHWLMT